MISYILVLCFVLVSVVRCKNDVPVLVWNSRSDQLDLHVPAWKKLPALALYENVLKKAVNNEPSPVAVFVEQSLSLEDFAWDVYPQVQKDFETRNFRQFLPHVTEPLDAIKYLANDQYAISKFDGKNFPDQSRSVLIIELDDVMDDENRPKLLRRHDKIIHEMCKSIEKKYGSATCVLTANRKSWIEPEHLWNRKLLQAEEETKSTGSLNVYHQPLGTIYTKSPPILLDTKTNTSYEIVLKGLQQITQSQAKNNANISVKTNAYDMNDQSKYQKVTLIFVFINNNSTYRLDNIQLIISDNVPNKLQSTTSISTSTGYSFHTPSPVVFKNSDYELTFKNLQVELYKTPKSRPSFSVADDTVTFFTIPIWNGIFVTGLLMTIVLVGLSMIFDIKTMDQFDDPKGKTVTINATE